ncbi:hypothetical protein SAY87_009839 [Trapa incisa]|uniref:Uncharacterized protein n=1 Tax=Trapa incisa TaxID=236973 RepID=A0AAN7K046_9MYRT|nr:hypothetical protein SAY87_009839 [Trapa incisa]
MPQDASPWNRRELKRERFESVARWRGSPSYHGELRLFPRAVAEPRRHSGHGKQGGWHSISRTIPMLGDGKQFRVYRDNRGFSAPRESRGGQSLEPSRGSFQMMLKQCGDGNILRDEHGKRNDANHLSPCQKVDEKRLVDSVEWKLRRWKHKGSSPSRDSSLHDSSNAKAAHSWVEWNNESQSNTIIFAHSTLEKDGDYMFLTNQSEEQTSNKKPRLGWGEGLAKYEKKKVEFPFGSSLEGGGIESNLSIHLDAADRTSGDWPVSDSTSPAISLSALDSSFTMKDQAEKSGQDNLSNLQLPVSGSQTGHQEFSVDKEKLDMSSAVWGDLSLVQLPDDISLDSASALSISMDELLHRKDDILKALLKTESEIDLLENGLRCFPSDHGHVCANSISSCFNLKDYAIPSSGQDDIASVISQPASLPIASSVDTDLGKMCYLNRTIPDFHCRGTVNMLAKDNQLVNEGAHPGTTTEMVKAVSGSSREDIVQPFEYVNLHGDAESKLCELTLPIKEHANSESSNVFSNLFMKDHDKSNVAKVGFLYPLPDNSRIREKFCRRKRLSIFKERVLALKFKAFHHLWQNDRHLLSVRIDQLKAKKLDRCQKPLSIFAHVSSSGTMRMVPNKEIIHYTDKMLTDSCWRICREALKMPALFLDERETIASRFISYNGLVEDPCAVEKERAVINPWTLEERETFLEMMGKYGKDFKRIASFLDHKTTADCIQFYYKNHKSNIFQGLKKNPHTGMHPKLPSAYTYMKTFGKRRNHAFNAVSHDILGEPSLVASGDQANDAGYEVDLGSCYGRFSLHPRCTSGPSWVNTFDDEREAIAADVLTKIGSSVVQVKSCREDFSDWTDVEKSKFIQAVSLYGKDFAMISQFLKTRSGGQCRAFFNKARKCLGLDLILPAPAWNTLKGDASAGGDDMDGPHSTKNGPFICQDLSIDDEDHNSLVSVKMEATDVIDCGSSTNLKEGACRSGSTRRAVSKEKFLRTPLKSCALRHVNNQTSDQSPRAVKRWSALLAADSSSCSKFSLSSEFKDLSPVEIDQMEKPPLTIITDSPSFHCVVTKTQNRNHRPGIWKQPSDDSDGNMPNLQELESAGCVGGFKLFGKRILTRMPLQKYPDSCLHGKDKRMGAKVPLNLIGRSVEGRHSSVQEFSMDDHKGLKNIPIRSYGFWDGTKVQTIPCLPDAASLLSRYPATLSKHPLQEVAKSSECNLHKSSSHSAILAWDTAPKHHHSELNVGPGPKQQGGVEWSV